ncbi:hypothetical protein SLA2020_413050 [Shorea laevis]
MKLHFCAKFFPLQLQNHHQNSSRVLASLFSTKTLDQLFPPSSSTQSLFHRIKTIRNPKISVLPVLEQWVKGGRSIGKLELQHLVRMMRESQRYGHALEISQWMTDRRYFILSPSDIAIRLDLIHKVHGLEHAENFFNKVSNNLKTSKVYGALLKCYVQEKSVNKAEDVMEKMRKMGVIASSFPYNWLISLYAHSGECDKIDILVQEMERKGFPQDTYTMTNRMAAYVAASNIFGMEKILNQMEDSPEFVVGWKLYSIAALGYQKVGSIERSIKMLRKMEEMMPLRRRPALDFLLTLYANIGEKDELLRVWKTFNPAKEQMDELYCHMITSLAKLDDLEGAEKIFEEWESQCTMYDFRVLNRLLVAYCRIGLLEKAEVVVTKAVEGRTPYASTWNILAMGYMEQKQMAKAVEMLKKAMSVARGGWRPHPTTLTAACLDYLEEKGDVEVADEIIRFFQHSGPLTRDIYHRLLRSCIKAGKSVSEVLDQMKMDGFDTDEETEKILKTGSS